MVEVDGNNLVYEFEADELNAAGTSGAPVLNEKNEVVGMNTSGGEQDGVHLGLANPASAIIKLIQESTQKD